MKIKELLKMLELSLQLNFERKTLLLPAASQSVIEGTAQPIFQARNVQKSCSQMLPQDSRKNLSQPLADLIDGNDGTSLVFLISQMFFGVFYSFLRFLIFLKVFSLSTSL